MSEKYEFETYCKIYPDKLLSLDEWKTQTKTIQITPQIERYMYQIFEAATDAIERYPGYSPILKKVIEWALEQGIMSQDDEECLPLF